MDAQVGVLWVLAVGVVTAVAVQEAFGGDVAGPWQVDVWVAGKDGYHTYRIPAVIATPKGTLLAFCEGRKTSQADHGDIDLLLKRSSDGGRTWEPQQIVHEEGNDAMVTIGNPCPVVDQTTGVIWLPFCRDNDHVLITHSSDDGRSWAKPTEITSAVKNPGWGWYATGPGVGIQIRHGPHRGALVIPCDHHEQGDGGGAKHSHIFYSRDHGASWQLGGSADRHTDECQVVERDDSSGSMILNMRNYWQRDGGRADRGGMRAVAESNDGGDTWSELRFDSQLVEPVCQASLVRYSWRDQGGKSQLLFSNPASRKSRHQMTVRLSYDEGASWPVSGLLYEGPAAYSCLVVGPGPSIGCLYENGTKGPYERIVFARFGLEWLTGAEAQ